jgi:hypothetical protein
MVWRTVAAQALACRAVWRAWRSGMLRGGLASAAICALAAGIGPAVVETNRSASAQESLSVRITAEPPIVNPGEAAVLHWRTGGAVHCTIPQLPEVTINLPEGTSPPIIPQPATAIGRETESHEIKYVMICSGQGGPASDTTVVTIEPLARVTKFTADPKTIRPGGTRTTKLTWSTEAAEHCRLYPGGGDVPPNQTGLIVTPTDTTTYSLECTGERTRAPAARAETVTMLPAQITSFAAEPAGPVVPGTDITLHWTLEAYGECDLGPRLGKVSGPTGEKHITVWQTTTYTLTCAGPGGATFWTTTVEAPDRVPVGSVIDWWPPPGSNGVPPANYAVCDGSEIQDPDSPFYKKKVPDLRQQFVRGAASPSGVGKPGGSADFKTTVRVGLPVTTGAIRAAAPPSSAKHSEGVVVKRELQEAGSWRFSMSSEMGKKGIYEYDGQHVHDLGGDATGPLQVPTLPPYVDLLKIIRIK